MSLDLTKEKALKYAKLAVEADENKDFDLSLKYYKKTITFYSALLPCKSYLDDNDKKSLNLAALRKYLARAEQISSMIQPFTQSFISDSEEVLQTPAFDSHLLKTLKEDPSGLIKIEKPSVQWDEIKGLDNLKNLLGETIHVRRTCQNPNLSPPWQTVLLFGAGCSGKQVLVEACCTEMEASLVSLKAKKIPEIAKPEKILRTLFEIADKNRPVVVFIEEVHLLMNNQSQVSGVLAEFLSQLEKTEKFQDFIVFCSSTKPWKLDLDFVRKVERKVYVPLPDWKTRKQMICQGGLIGSRLESQLELLADATFGFSGQDLRELRKALIQSHLQEENGKNCEDEKNDDLNTSKSTQDDKINEKHLCFVYEAIKMIRPSVNLRTFVKYQYFAEL